jgi:hypothetical protein
MAISKIGAGEGSVTEATRERGILLGARMESSMSLEVLMPGEATLADDALEWLIGHPSASMGDRHGRGKSHCRAWRNQNGRKSGYVFSARQRPVILMFGSFALIGVECIRGKSVDL